MAGKHRKSKRHGEKGEKRSKRHRKSKKRSSSKSGGGFFRVDAAGLPCPPYAGLTSAYGAPCSWAMRQPGVPREYRRFVPPFRLGAQYQAALDAANPASIYQLRHSGLDVNRRDARAAYERQLAFDAYSNRNFGPLQQYELGRSLQKNRAARQAAAFGFNPMMAMAGGGGFNPFMMYGMGGK